MVVVALTVVTRVDFSLVLVYGGAAVVPFINLPVALVRFSVNIVLFVTKVGFLVAVFSEVGLLDKEVCFSVVDALVLLESCLGVALLSVLALVVVPDVGVDRPELIFVFVDCVVVGLVDSWFVPVCESVDVLVTVEVLTELVGSSVDVALDVDKLSVDSVLEVEDWLACFVVIPVEDPSVEEIVGLGFPVVK